jgi:hypothetical protein
MDLKELKPTKNTIEVTLVHPLNNGPLLNDDGTAMTISVYTQYSKEYKEVMYERADKRIKETKDSGEDFTFSARYAEESSIDILARTTSSWSITYDGKQPELTIDTAKEIYSELFWVKPQIDKAIADDEVFT